MPSLVTFSIAIVHAGARESKSSAGTGRSAAAAVVASVAAFGLMYAMNIGTTVGCSTDACVVGAIAYWTLNPGWSVRVRNETALVGWVSVYAIVSFGVLVVASLVTGLAQARVQSVPAHHGIRILAVTGSYAMVLGAVLAAKLTWSRRSAPHSLD